MKKLFKFKLFIVFLTIALISFGFMEGDKKGRGLSKNKSVSHFNKTNESGKNGDAYRLNINNLNVPLNNVGTIADVDIPPNSTLGRFGNSSFLFSAGFFVTGYSNNILWGAAQATASLIENFVPGPVSSKFDPNAVMYVVRKDDTPFSKSWQDWSDAVSLGAAFYDGDGDGSYTPIDKNSNQIWDVDEDAPDMLGDETIWCIYNDGQPSAQRERFAGVEPQGIEVKQTVFAFASKGALGNIIFVRYRLKNTGTKSDNLKDVIFSVWADPDLGNNKDDLIGVDTLRNAGYTYNSGPDALYGTNPPCFIIDFFSGPVKYIPGVTYTDVNANGIYDAGDISLDTAYSSRGQLIGKIAFPGAKNLPISSFVHYQQSDPVLGDPNTEVEARNYMLGKNKIGETLNPCTFTLGSVIGVDCALVDPRFWYSGDPVTNIGWMNTAISDQRQMTNIGPFDMPKDEEIEITVAYVVGQGSTALNSITEARRIDDGAQFIFDQNFAAPSAPPIVRPEIETGEDFIDLIWNTPPQVGYINKTAAYDLHFQGYNVYAYLTNSTQPEVGNIINSKLLTSYDVSDTIKNVYKENAETGGIEKIYSESSNPLEYQVFTDSTTGLIRLRITKDPFTGNSLIKGKPYYFAISSYALNYMGLYRKNPDELPGTAGDFVVSAKAFVGEVENVAKIINYKNQNGIVMGEDIYNPPLPVISSNHINGAASGTVGYDIVDKANFKPGVFTVSFIKDKTSASYKTMWRIQDANGTVLLDSQKVMSYGNESVAQEKINGFLVRVQDIIARVDSPYVYSGTKWFKPVDYTKGTGVFYVGKDLPQSQEVTELSGVLSNVMTADQLRKVELRFGSGGKAYRYLQGYAGTPATLSYKYAAAVTAADTVNKGKVGKLGEGFVDVPFTAWVVDSLLKEEHQLAVGFLERRLTPSYNRANPDGIWNPTDSLRGSGEVIVIFNTPYDATGSQKEYTGGVFNLSGGSTITRWADLLKKPGAANTTLPDTGVTGMTPEQLKTFNSPWFNAMYVVGLEKTDNSSNYIDGDKLIISLKTYPYTEKDVYKIEAGSVLTDDQKKDIFQRVNVYPNPLYGFNVATSYNANPADEPFVTFSNLPENITIKIYSLSGSLLRTLTTANKSAPTSPTLRWNLQNESGLRVASGMYLAIVSSPQYGEKILKFAVILPQKQIQKY